MKNLIRKTLIGLLGLLLVLQFFRGQPPEIIKDNPNDLLNNYKLSGEIEDLISSACYDCHSNETVYPWYSHITPVSWMVFSHVRKGRDELNFSEWTTLRKSRRIRKLKDIGEEVSEGEMPLKSYRIMHGSARLTQEERDLIANWAESYIDEVMKE